MNQSTFEHHAQASCERAYSVARAICGSTAQAEDVAQETMLRLWNLHEDLASGDDLLRMAGVVARGLAIDMVRRQKTVPIDTTSSNLLPQAPPPDQKLEDSEELAWLMRKMDSLPTAQSTILRLRQVEGRSNEEIATLLGIDRRSVATMLSRARRQLLKELKERNTPKSKHPL